MGCFWILQPENQICSLCKCSDEGICIPVFYTNLFLVNRHSSWVPKPLQLCISMILRLKFISSSELKAGAGCFCLTGFVGDPGAKLLIALMSQQVNKHSPATVPILQGHKRFLDFSAKPVKKGSSWPLKCSSLWKISNIHKRRENCIIYPPWTHHLALIITNSRPITFYLYPYSSPLLNNFEANSRCHVSPSVNISVTAPSYGHQNPSLQGIRSLPPTPMMLRSFGQYLHLCLRGSPWVWQAQGLTEFSPKSDLLLREKGACIKCLAVRPPCASFLVSAELLPNN